MTAFPAGSSSEGGTPRGAALGGARSPAAIRAALARAWRGVRWYLREWSGEARWDEYLAHCRAYGHEPVSRREFEQRRAEVAELSARDRCC